MKLEDMELFVTLAQQGSFTKAADFTGIPKSTISRRISGLEKQLGVQLLARTTRKLSLTEVGESYLEGCQQLLEQANTLEHNTKQLNQEPSGTLSLFLPTALIRAFWPVILDMISSYPELKVEAASSEGRQEYQMAKRYDLMFHVDEPKDSSLIARRIAAFRYDYYASPGYVQQHGYLEKPSDVDEHLILYNSVSQTPNHFWRFEYQGELVLQAIDPRISVQNPELNVDLCLQDKGIALLPYMLAKPLLDSGQLVRVYRPKQDLSANIYAIYHSRRFLPAKVTVFLDKVAEFLELHPH